MHCGALPVGCAVQLQACFLVADDVMDASVTRRGQPCWYKLPGVDMIAVNDAFLLRSALFVFLKKYFSGEAYYLRLIEMFNEVRDHWSRFASHRHFHAQRGVFSLLIDAVHAQVILQTELGQLLDLTSAPMGGPVDLSRFTLER